MNKSISSHIPAQTSATSRGPLTSANKLKMSSNNLNASINSNNTGPLRT